MKPIRTASSNHNFGPPPNVTDGSIGDLPCKIVDEPGYREIVSVWSRRRARRDRRRPEHPARRRLDRRVPARLARRHPRTARRRCGTAASALLQLRTALAADEISC
jgi:hypothetical protein